MKTYQINSKVKVHIYRGKNIDIVSGTITELTTKGAFVRNSRERNLELKGEWFPFSSLHSRMELVK